MLLAQAFAERHDDARPGGRIVLLTSGQHLGPMPGEAGSPPEDSAWMTGQAIDAEGGFRRQIVCNQGLTK